MTKKVAVVTGSNKGIGYAIVKKLCDTFDGDVFLTARDEERGLNAIKSLEELGYQPKFHLLDVTVPESIKKLRDHIVDNYGGLDILINNAGISGLSYLGNSTEPIADHAQETMRVNYFGLRDTCNILFPILRPHARVVNITSLFGHSSFIPGKNLRDKFTSSDLTEESLDSLISAFIKAAENGTYKEEGWPVEEFCAYVVSKVGVSALSRIQQRKFLEDERPDIIVNHVHPGYVDTEINNHTGHLTTEQGAEAPVFAALLPENSTEPKGDYIWFTKMVVDWIIDVDLKAIDTGP